MVKLSGNFVTFELSNVKELGVCFNNIDNSVYAFGNDLNTLGSTGVSVVANTWYLIDYKFNVG